MRLRLAQAWEGWHSAHVEAEWLLEQRVRDCARRLAGGTALRALAGWLAVAAQAHAASPSRVRCPLRALRPDIANGRPADGANDDGAAKRFATATPSFSLQGMLSDDDSDE